MTNYIETVRALAEEGVSQAEIAKRIGVTRQRVHQYIVAIRKADPRFLIHSVCPACDTMFEISGHRRVWCSPECARLWSNKIPCACGGLKSKHAKFCRKCQGLDELAAKCAELYDSGLTGREIAEIVGKTSETCTRLARRGGASIRKPGPKKKDESTP
jgi:hypothetical protein